MAAALFAIAAFYLITTGIFAQEEPVQDEIPAVAEAEAAAPAVDPIIAVEQALSLEEGSAGAMQPAPAASAWGILRVLLTLAVVAVAIYGIVYFIKRVGRGGGEQDPFLKVLASASLGVNRSAHIISVGSRAWLVGAAEHGVSLISEIDDREVMDAMLLEDSRKSSEAPAGRFPDFKTLLQRLGMPSNSGAPSGPESIRKRRERLKGL